MGRAVPVVGPMVLPVTCSTCKVSLVEPVSGLRHPAHIGLVCRTLSSHVISLHFVPSITLLLHFARPARPTDAAVPWCGHQCRVALVYGLDDDLP